MSAQDVISQVQTNMASVIVTLKIMPETPETDLAVVTEEAKKHIEQFAGEGDVKVEEEPVAFGLKAIKIIFIMDESIGSTESLENDVAKVSGVQSVEITDVRRAIG